MIELFSFCSVLMQYRRWLRRIVFILLIYGIVRVLSIRRQSTQKLLTESDVAHWTKFLPHYNESQIRIPRIIHQLWKDAQVPDSWSQTVGSVRDWNRARFRYVHWTDEQMDQFVRENEPEFYKRTFRKYRLNIQRVDSFRFVVLYHYGGVYIDMDNGCRKSFESLFQILELIDSKSKHICAFPRTSPFGISNGFMITTAGHPLFRFLLENLNHFNWNYLVDYLTVMMSAGPLYLSIQEFYFDQQKTKSSVRILDEIVYSSIYTWHTPGNSWHGRDARIILFVYHKIRNHFRVFSLTMIFLIILIVFRKKLSSYLFRKRGY